MVHRYQKPAIVKHLRLFDVDCSTHEHEVVFTEIRDHLDLDKNYQVFCWCIDLFGWPEKLSIIFSNQSDMGEREQKRGIQIQKIQAKTPGDRAGGFSQDYWFTGFWHGEQDFINAELKSVIKAEELMSSREWGGQIFESPFQWDGREYNPQFLNDLKDCRCKVHIKSANYELLVHQVGDFLSLHFCNEDAPLDLLNKFIQIVEKYADTGTSFRTEFDHSFWLENLSSEGIIELFRCLSGSICGWQSNFDPRIPKVLMRESHFLPNLVYLKNQLKEYMRLAEKNNYRIYVKLESGQSGISPYKYIVIDEERGGINLSLTRVKIDDFGFWNINFTHDNRFYLSDGPEIYKKIQNYKADIEFVPD